MPRFLVCLVGALFSAIGAATADYVVSTTSLARYEPDPPNPVIVVGRVMTTHPITISDGRTSAVVTAAENLQVGQIVRLRANWDGTALNVVSADVLRRAYPIVLTLGDSITRNPPIPSLGWFGDWGMKASSESNDYVHRILDMARAADPANASIHHSSSGGGQAGGRIDDVIAKLDTWRSYHPDLITLQIGENDEGISNDLFIAKYAYLLDELLRNTPTPRIFCWGPWTSSQAYVPGVRAADLDLLMQAECAKRGIPFSSVRDVAMNAANHDPGGGPVNWHPNDGGMQGYADLFWSALGPELTSGW